MMTPPAESVETKGKTIQKRPENWLAKWTPLLGDRPCLTALDIGCGSGADTRYLSQKGYRVLSMDISSESLAGCKEEQPDNHFVLSNLEQGLPCHKKSIDLMIANLSLHFFSWETTKRIMVDLLESLKEGGWLFTRLNSTRDIHPRIASEPEIEPNYFQTNRIKKRFFDEAMVDDLFSDCWKIHAMEEVFTYRHKKPKLVWEVIAQKD